jgi:hypothetical protein
MNMRLNVLIFLIFLILGELYRSMKDQDIWVASENLSSNAAQRFIEGEKDA